MANRKAGISIESSQRPVYVERVNAAIDYVEHHLGSELTLDELAQVAHFSPFHFHRVFAAMTGETIGRFINRTRLERAATLLVQQPRTPITTIAAQCGFANSSSFSRAFRSNFSMSPTQWRQGGHRNHKTAPQQDYTALLAEPDRFGIVAKHSAPGSPPTWTIRCGDLAPTTLNVVRLPDIEVAYVRYTGKYAGEADVFADIFSRLMSWAEPRGYVSTDAWVLAVYHDNPSITDDARLRVSACISVPSDVPAEGDIGRMMVAGGQTAVAGFELGEQDYAQAWLAVAAWLPDSGYEPDDRLPYERYFIGRAAAPGKEYVEICFPVRPLRVY